MIKKQLIDVKETKAILGCGINKVYELARQPDFPSIRVGRKILVDLDSLLNVWIPNRMETSSKRIK